MASDGGQIPDSEPEYPALPVIKWFPGAPRPPPRPSVFPWALNSVPCATEESQPSITPSSPVSDGGHHTVPPQSSFIATADSVVDEPSEPRFHFRKRLPRQLNIYAYDRAMHGEYHHYTARDTPLSEDPDFIDSQHSVDEAPPSPNSLQFEMELPPSSPELGAQRLGAEDIGDTDTGGQTSIPLMNSEGDEYSDASDSEGSMNEFVHGLKSFEKRVRGVLPASVQPELQELQSSASGAYSDSMHSSESLPPSQLSFSGDVQEAQHIDYMMAPRKRGAAAGSSRVSGPRHAAVPKISRTRRLRLEALVHDLGTKAAPYMRVAARTSRTRGRGVDVPTRKLILHSDGKGHEGEHSLARWRKGIKTIPEVRGKDLEGSVRPADTRTPAQVASAARGSKIVNMSSRPRTTSKKRHPAIPRRQITGGSRDLARMFARQVTASELTHGQEQEQHQPSRSDAAKPPKKRYRGRSGDVVFRTTIVEMPTGRYAPRPGRPQPAARAIHPVLSSSLEPLPFPGESTTLVLPTIDQHISPRSFGLSPLPRRDFDKTTFFGSNTLSLLSNSFQLWDAVIRTPERELFGPPLQKTSIAIIRQRFRELFAILTGEIGDIDEALYARIYDYLLQVTGDIIQQHTIVDADIVSTVITESTEILAGLLHSDRSQPRRIKRLQLLFATFTLLVVKSDAALDPLKYEQKLQSTRDAALGVLFTHIDFVLYEFRDAEELHTTGAYSQSSAAVEIVLILLSAGEIAYAFRFLSSKEHRLEVGWLLLFLSAAGMQYMERSPWEPGWSYALQLLRAQNLSSSSRKLLMERTMQLVTQWKWPIFPDILFMFFDFYAKQRNYADSHGEAIELPGYFYHGPFDGSTHHNVEHHVFLELLGLTLQKYRTQRNKIMARKIVGRVTPLSTLSLPETKPVSAADLSRVSQQYGILLVCFRFCEPEVRPSINQIIDLVQLNSAHIAIRIKALSAWQILVRVLNHENLAQDKTQEWIQQLCQTSLIQYKDFKERQVQPTAIRQLETFFNEMYRMLLAVGPQHFMSEQMVEPLLTGLPDEVNEKLWDAVGAVVRAQSWPIFERLTETILTHFGRKYAKPWEIKRFGLMLAHRESSLSIIDHWPNWETEPMLLSVVFGNRGIWSSSLEQFAIRRLAVYAVRPTWTEEPDALKAFKRHLAWIPSLTRESSFNERTTLIQGLLSYLRQSANGETVADMMLEETRESLKLQSDESAAQKRYQAFVAQVRRMTFESFSTLASRHAKWFNDVADYGVEVSQRNILDSIKQKSFGRLEYFLAYKLRAALEQTNVSGFASDLIAALDLQNMAAAQGAFNFVVNSLFASYARLAIHARPLEQLLPFLTSIVGKLVGRDDRLLYSPLEFLQALLFYVEYYLVRLGETPMLIPMAAGLYSMSTGVLRQAYLLQQAADTNTPGFERFFKALATIAPHVLRKQETPSYTWESQQLSPGPERNEVGDAAILQALRDAPRLEVPEDTPDLRLAVHRFMTLHKLYKTAKGSHKKAQALA